MLYDPTSWRAALSVPWMFFDLETTSTKVDDAGICELGLEVYDASSPVGPEGLPLPVFTWCDRFHPGSVIPEEATAIHGIRNDDVRHRPHVSTIRDWLGDMMSRCVVCGYNSRRYDLAVVARVMGLMAPSQLDVQDFVKACSDRRLARWRGTQEAVHLDDQGNPVFTRTPLPVCTIGLRHVKGKLESVHAMLRGRELVGAHGAAADTRATAEVFFAGIDVFGLDATPDALVKLAWEYAGFIRPSARGMVINAGTFEGMLLRDKWRQDPTFIRWMFDTKTDMDPLSLDRVRQELGQAEVDRCCRIKRRR